jgi:hypothetical protein
MLPMVHPVRLCRVGGDAFLGSEGDERSLVSGVSERSSGTGREVERLELQLSTGTQNTSSNTYFLRFATSCRH